MEGQGERMSKREFSRSDKGDQGAKGKENVTGWAWYVGWFAYGPMQMVMGWWGCSLASCTVWACRRVVVLATCDLSKLISASLAFSLAIVSLPHLILFISML